MSFIYFVHKIYGLTTKQERNIYNSIYCIIIGLGLEFGEFPLFVNVDKFESQVFRWGLNQTGFVLQRTVVVFHFELSNDTEMKYEWN